MDALYNYTSYRELLKDYVSSQKAKWGLKSRLAEVMGIHNAYLSQVLSGEKDLSLEQMERFGRHLSLTEPEMNFLLILLQENRAGSQELRIFFEKSLDKLRRDQTNVSRRLGEKKNLNELEQMIYFSNWQFAAIHMALQIPNLRQPTKLAERFHIEESRVLEVLEFLVKEGLAEKRNNEFHPTEVWVRLSKRSPMITQHHTNVKYKALSSVVEAKEKNLHYSGYFTFAEKDLPRIKEIWLNAIKEMQKVVEPSPPENLFALSLDLFEF